MKRWTLLTLSLALVFLLAACGTETPGTNNTNSGMGSNPDNSLGDAMEEGKDDLEDMVDEGKDKLDDMAEEGRDELDHMLEDGKADTGTDGDLTRPG